MKKILQDRLLLFTVCLTFVLLLIQPLRWSSLPGLIHWPTIITLSALLITTSAIKRSNLITCWANRLAGIVHTERALWFLLISFAAVSAMILTNDIALFLIIPFTIKLRETISGDLRTLLVFETIAVNAGSSFSPIGNPQNIYLWQHFGVSFTGFMHAMIVPTFIQLILLIIAIFFIVDTRSLPIPFTPKYTPVDFKLAEGSIVLLIGFMITERFNFGLYALLFIAFIFLITYRNILFNVDWTLIILFMLLFIDTGIIRQLPFLKDFIQMFNMSKPLQIVGTGISTSQLISNVPATLLLSHFTDQWKYLAWGVNIGGNGVLIASFANLITIRLAKSQKIISHYHYYAVPFLLLSSLFTYIWIIL